MSLGVSSIGFLGAGKIASALARGFLAAGLISKDRITASAPSRKDLEKIEDLGINVTESNEETAKNSEVLLVAVKPHVVPKVLKEVSPCITKDHLIVSVAAGVTIETIEKNLPDNTRVIRCMPNTPVVVRNGVTIYSQGTAVQEGDKNLVHQLLMSVGICHEMDEY
ncbi:PREDICTED: pyrroline-5-carboxylate reductase 1, mitochondrial-like, partial [Amphimedon queenslandica]|uniref:Pyrroline-5-carboxylate reductase catalytic N-terminal domain-containing protein n=1 Tax=Amphimedon queenslandica TaxID=400682 RepID=A0AAN0IGD6_AMPQE